MGRHTPLFKQALAASGRRGHAIVGPARQHAYRVLGFDQVTGGMRCSANWCWPGT